MIRFLVALFGAAVGLAVVALVAWYGWRSAAEPVERALAAAVNGSIAVAAIFGPPVAVHLWRAHRAWSLVVGAGALALLALNMTNSLGFLASKSTLQRDAEQLQRSERQLLIDDVARLQSEISALEFEPETAASVDAARAAVAAALAAEQAECEIVGPNCRKRVTARENAAAALQAAERNYAATEHAGDLSAALRARRAELAAAPAVGDDQAQGNALATLLGLGDGAGAVAASWQRLGSAIALELIAVLSLIVAEVLRSAPTAAESSPPAPTAAGDLSQVLRDALIMRKSGEVPAAALLDAFARQCRARGIEPLGPQAAAAALEALLERSPGLRVEKRATGLVLCGAQLRKEA